MSGFVLLTRTAHVAFRSYIVKHNDYFYGTNLTTH